MKSPDQPTQFIAYYRVSTDKQGQSGLGLEAQRAAVFQHVGLSGGLLNEYVEVESGKKHLNRPQLLAALGECKRRKATLIVAKLDRLGRNVAFLSTLMESGVEFVCCDNPHANRLMLHMLAAFAEHEREMISQRTKAALAAAKARGVKLGNPRWEESVKKAAAARRRTPAQTTAEMIQDLRKEGLSLRAIAQRLNDMNLRTASGGGRWHASSVRAVLEMRTEEQLPKAA